MVASYIPRFSLASKASYHEDGVHIAMSLSIYRESSKRESACKVWFKRCPHLDNRPQRLTVIMYFLQWRKVSIKQTQPGVIMLYSDMFTETQAERSDED